MKPHSFPFRLVIFGLLLLSSVFLLLSCSQFANHPRENDVPDFSVFQDILKSGEPGPSLISIPAGRFEMGVSAASPIKRPTELPQHQVRIFTPFAISQYEITFSEYDRFVKDTGYRRPSDKGWGSKFWGRGKTPVFDVNWHDAQEYTRWLSQQTGYRYRLPTEAEWEYAARAGTGSAFHTGDCIHTDQANFHGRNPFGNCPVPPDYRGKVVEVGQFEPNPWGLFDIHGNIFEWTLDCWHENYIGAPVDGSAWLDEGPTANCQRRVLRGGSWSSFVNDIRSANRGNNDINYRSIFIGFRVVREL